MSNVEMKVNLTGKTAVVTGAARGLGAMFAMRLAEQGARVALVDILDSSEVCSQIIDAGGKCIGIRADISSPEAVAGVAQQVDEAFGGADILVNNAAIHPTPTPFTELSFDYWRKTMSINLDSVFLMSQAFVPQLIAKGWGRIINISSSSANTAPPMGAPYVASKGAVVALTRAMATEFGVNNITVNAVAPNPVRTPGAEDGVISEEMFQMVAAQQPIPRVMMPDDVSGVILFLCSDGSEFITGQNFHVDGGCVRGC